MNPAAVLKRLAGALGFALTFAATTNGVVADVLPERVPCPYGYEAEVCASDLNPGFEFIPVNGPLLFTGEDMRGEVISVRVEVELNSGLSVQDTLDEVLSVLGDYRGWTGPGALAFQHVASDEPDLTILLAKPASVDAFCAPLDTEGYYSCRNGGRAILNIERWKAGVPHWTASLAEYRAYLINHEVGHFLGMGHVRCPQAGAPAPVMQQQSIDLMGCEPNGWPHQ